MLINLLFSIMLYLCKNLTGNSLRADVSFDLEQLNVHVKLKGKAPKIKGVAQHLRKEKQKNTGGYVWHHSIALSVFQSSRIQIARRGVRTGSVVNVAARTAARRTPPLDEEYVQEIEEPIILLHFLILNNIKSGKSAYRTEQITSST
jgi:hypothetical protein